MEKVSVCNLIGGEKIVKEIVTVGLVLIPAGTILKKEYILKLKELNVNSVFIESKLEKSKLVNEIIEQRIQNDCTSIVRSTIERYSYCANTELQEIITVAECIISDVLIEPEVMYNISCVRDKNESIYSHSVNVCAMSVLIALKIKLSRERIKQLAIGALLHDLGIVFLPIFLQSIMLDQCNEEQRKLVKKHVITGYSMLEKENWLSAAAKDIILSHHERCDGTGYPMHLTQKKIRLEVKIVAVCDEFDNRVYGNYVRKQKVHTVIDYITSEAGREFDFRVIQMFIDSIAVYPIDTVVILNTNQQGVVIHQNHKMPTRPVIRLIQNNELSDIILDLTQELTVSIVDTIETK